MLRCVQDAHWLDMLLGDKPDDDARNRIVDVTETERKRREAVWELFKSECVFLIDHLMALKHVSLTLAIVLLLITNSQPVSWAHNHKEQWFAVKLQIEAEFKLNARPEY